MSSLHEEFYTLQSMMKLYLLQDCSRDAKIVTEQENYEYFKNYALQQKKVNRPVPQSIPKPTPVVQPPSLKAPLKPPPPIKPKEEVKIKIDAATPIASKPIESHPYPVKPVEIDLSDIRKRFTELFPGHVIMDQIPEMTNAKSCSNCEALVVSFSNDPKHHQFLTNLTKAIDDLLYPATLIAAPTFNQNDVKAYPDLRVFIAPEQDTLTHPIFSQWVEKLRENRINVILLSNIDDYLNNPKLKKQLWDMLKGFQT